MTTSASRAAGGRGFSLIELMVSVAIVGLLSSVAVPGYQRMTLRTKAAERSSIMRAIAIAIGDTALTREPQAFPADPLVGPWNPVGIPGTTKQPMNWALGDWPRIPVVVQGATYYSYQFTASDNVGVGPPFIVLSALGDVDGDGNNSLKTQTYVGVGYSFVMTSEVPAPGDPADNVF